MTKDMRGANARFRSSLEASNVFRMTVKVLAVLGVALVVAGEIAIIINIFRELGGLMGLIDGVLTPAQSILGAIQGWLHIYR